MDKILTFYLNPPHLFGWSVLPQSWVLYQSSGRLRVLCRNVAVASASVFQIESCGSWALFEPLSQLRSHRPNCSYHHSEPIWPFPSIILSNSSFFICSFQSYGYEHAQCKTSRDWILPHYIYSAKQTRKQSLDLLA